MWDAVCIVPGDDVAVAIRDIAGVVSVLVGGEVMERVLPSTIPLGHKFALSDMPAGSQVRKYGEVIGVLTRAVAAGDHVHVHNLVSQRARRAEPYRSDGIGAARSDRVSAGCRE